MIEKFLKIAKDEENGIDSLRNFNFIREPRFRENDQKRNGMFVEFKDFLNANFDAESIAKKSTTNILDQFSEHRIKENGGKYSAHPGLQGRDAGEYFGKKTVVVLKSLYDKNEDHQVLRVLLPKKWDQELKQIVQDLGAAVTAEIDGPVSSGVETRIKGKINNNMSSVLGKWAAAEESFDRDRRLSPEPMGAKPKQRRKIRKEPVLKDDIWWISCLKDTEHWIVASEGACDHVSLFRAFLGLGSSHDSNSDDDTISDSLARVGRMYVHFSVSEDEKIIPKSQPNPFSEGTPDLWLGAGNEGGKTVQMIDSHCTSLNHDNCNCGVACLPEAVTSYENLKDFPRKCRKIAVAYMFRDDLLRFGRGTKGSETMAELIRRKA